MGFKRCDMKHIFWVGYIKWYISIAIWSLESISVGFCGQMTQNWNFYWKSIVLCIFKMRYASEMFDLSRWSGFTLRSFLTLKLIWRLQPTCQMLCLCLCIPHVTRDVPGISRLWCQFMVVTTALLRDRDGKGLKLNPRNSFWEPMSVSGLVLKKHAHFPTEQNLYGQTGICSHFENGHQSKNVKCFPRL